MSGDYLGKSPLEQIKEYVLEQSRGWTNSDESGKSPSPRSIEQMIGAEIEAERSKMAMTKAVASPLGSDHSILASPHKKKKNLTPPELMDVPFGTSPGGVIIDDPVRTIQEAAVAVIRHYEKSILVKGLPPEELVKMTRNHLVSETGVEFYKNYVRRVVWGMIDPRGLTPATQRARTRLLSGQSEKMVLDTDESRESTGGLFDYYRKEIERLKLEREMQKAAVEARSKKPLLNVQYDEGLNAGEAYIADFSHRINGAVAVVTETHKGAVIKEIKIEPRSVVKIEGI